MKNMKIDANGTEIRVMGDVVNEEAYISLTDIAKYKIQTMLLSWLRTGCVIIPQSHFWVCGNRFIIPILNLSNSIGLKWNREIMHLH